MLDLVRQGMSRGGADKDKIFLVRGRQVTLADALHYFNRKGIKDPKSLLEKESSSLTRDQSRTPEDYDVQTPTSTKADTFEARAARSESESQSPYESLVAHHPDDRTQQWLGDIKSSELADKVLNQVCARMGFGVLEPLPRFNNVCVEASIREDHPPTQEHARYLEAIYAQVKRHYGDLFYKREINLANQGPWSATSDDSLADQFYYLMYHGFSYLWNSQRQSALDNFREAFSMISQLLRDDHVGFLIYIFDLVIRHDGTGYEEALITLLQQVAEMAELVFKRRDHPIYLVASWLLNTRPEISRAWVCLSTMRKLLGFFQDSIGYFHAETIALLNTFATGLLNSKLYPEAAARFQQLVNAFQLTQGEHTYDVCYALRNTSEAFFHAKKYKESMQAIKMALDYSTNIPRLEEREIQVRCLRAMAELQNIVGDTSGATRSMQYVVDVCAATFGPEHAFTKRARMHQKSLRKGTVECETALPPMVYRLGRGGNAAKYVWTTRTSPTRLQS